MKKDSYKNIFKLVFIGIAAAAFGVSLGVFRTIAMTGPSQGVGSGYGSLGTDAAGNISVGTPTTQSAIKLLIVGSTTDSTAYGLQVQNSALSNIFTVRNDGNVGIGTVSPGTKLDVLGGARILNEGATPATPGAGKGMEFHYVTGYYTQGEGSYIFSYDRTGSAYKPLNMDASNLNFSIGGTTKMAIATSGNVGIGATNPTTTLSVAGTVHATGDICTDVGGKCLSGTSATSSLMCEVVSVANANYTMAANCDSGYTLTGGGVQDASYYCIEASMPNGNGWQGTCSSGMCNLWAICCKLH